MSNLPWQKSTYSPDASNCVYIAAAPAKAIRLRESDTPSTILTTTTDVLRHLIRTLKSADRRSASG
ncbi:DUF397 domain-containing protein [Streptomyces sp. N50]|uniref:DUF397 domain-containing protein n=1 Tax=Streptomyces sp. N50 TaxID=3081765 RepID=UPI00296209F3|nr:DUF397 domain-containing protein [Streptomyces sp. N50]WOX10042.1 DUF397 domain-containing protein [Streptomyces sp. N50]